MARGAALVSSYLYRNGLVRLLGVMWRDAAPRTGDAAVTAHIGTQYY